MARLRTSQRARRAGLDPLFGAPVGILPNVPGFFFLAESRVRYGNGERNSRPTSRNVNVETRTGNQARLPELRSAVLRLESYADRLSRMSIHLSSDAPAPAPALAPLGTGSACRGKEGRRAGGRRSRA